MTRVYERVRAQAREFVETETRARECLVRARLSAASVHSYLYTKGNNYYTLQNGLSRYVRKYWDSS